MLTAIVLTLNEEVRIGRCVSSLAFADRLVLIDSFSTDATLERAREAWRAAGRSGDALAILQRRWPGFRQARSDSAAWAGTDGWVVWVDADETVSDELRDELEGVVRHGATYDVARMPRLSRFLGREIRHGGWYPDRKARLARVGAAHWVDGPRGADVHEDLRPTAGGALGELRGHLFHEPFLSREEHRDTNRRYSALLGEALARSRRSENAGPVSTPVIWAKVAVKFIENYVFKLGVLDGRAGLVIALGSAQSLAWRLRTANAALLATPRERV